MLFQHESDPNELIVQRFVDADWLPISKITQRAGLSPSITRKCLMKLAARRKIEMVVRLPGSLSNQRCMQFRARASHD